MEDGLVLVFMSKIRFLRICLNPCYSGRWSRTQILVVVTFLWNCLNPCYSGRWSRTYEENQPNCNNCLNPYCYGRWSRTQQYLNCQII